MIVPLDASRLRSGQPLKVEATTDNELVEREPNDNPKQATPLTTPAYVGGRLWSPSAAADVDLYRFKSTTGQRWAIDTSAARRGSPADTKIEVLDAQGRPVQRLILQAVRDSYVTFRPISSRESDVRVFNWQEMELNQFMFMQGEICKIFRMPQGPDSGFAFYVSGGQRRGYFDTTATAHAMDEPCYIVEPHQPGEKLIPNGLPSFPLYYANDDDADREVGSDSRLMFTAAADGDYLVRVSDVRGFGGDRFAYRLTVRPAQPGYKITLVNRAPAVNTGSGVSLTFRADRIDGFDEDVTIETSGLPAGYTISAPVVVQAGHLDARAVLNAALDAKAMKPDDWQKVRFAARSMIAGATVTQEVAGFSNVMLGPKPELIVRLEPADLNIAPGQTITATLKVERNGFKDRVPFNVLNLPHGIIVDNIGLNGILVPENQTERKIFLSAANWVPETDRYVYAETTNFRGAKAGNQASRPLLLHVRAPENGCPWRSGSSGNAHDALKCGLPRRGSMAPVRSGRTNRPRAARVLILSLVSFAIGCHRAADHPDPRVTAQLERLTQQVESLQAKIDQLSEQVARLEQATLAKPAPKQIGAAERLQKRVTLIFPH